MAYPANTQRLRHHTQRGTSLVEVLVVLVILVLGIFSIARLFPGGFFALRSAENNTFADRLSQAQLEGLKQNNAFLLDAVYMYSNTLGFLPGVGPDDLTGTTANPFIPSNGAADATLNDINKARFIQNETFAVPSANTAADNNGVSIHALNYGPIFLPTPTVSYSAPGAPASVRGLPFVHTAPWKAVTGNSQQAVPGDVTGSYNVTGGYETPQDLVTAGQPSYAVDYTGQRIAVPPVTFAFGQSFTLVVKRQVQTSGGSPVTLTVTFYYPLLLPRSDTTGIDSNSAYNGGWFDPTDPAMYLDLSRPVVTDLPLPAGSSVGNWLPGTASLVRTVAAEPQATSGALADTLINLRNDPDPYRYVLINPDPSLTNVNMGVFAFNPRIAGQKLAVSYVAYDWHVIHEDEDVPQTAGTPIRLTLNHIRKSGDIGSDEAVYNGVFRPTDTTNVAAANYDLVLLDTDTGDMAGLTSVQSQPNSVFDIDAAAAGTSATPDQVAVSYLGGRVSLPTNPSNAWYYGIHKHVRVFYQGDLGWAVSVQKAPSLYAPGTDGSLGVGQYAVSSANPLHLHFPHCDSGKIVEVDAINYQDKNGNPQEASGVSGTIGSDAISGDSDYIDLSTFLPNADPTRGVQIGAVRGISARAVVIWKERSNWKTRSLDTVLTRTQ